MFDPAYQSRRLLRSSPHSWRMPPGSKLRQPAPQGLHRGLYAAPRQQRPRRRRAPPGTAARRSGPEGCRPGRRREAAPETVAGQERSGSSGEPRGDRERGRGDGGLGVSGKAPQADQSCAHRLVEGRARLPAQDPEEAPVVRRGIITLMPCERRCVREGWPAMALSPATGRRRGRPRLRRTAPVSSRAERAVLSRRSPPVI
jgi:hypothetical protein